MRNKVNPQRWIMLGIIGIFLIATLMHFVYDFFGNSFIVGLIAPVNESIFEHIKLIILPTILWWSIYYFVNNEYIDKNNWFLGMLLSLIVMILLIPMLYYFYTGAFGVESLFVAILLLFISILIAQLIGRHIYNYSEGNISSKASIFISILILIIFAVLTVATPKLPIFKDSVTGTYGINKET